MELPSDIYQGTPELNNMLTEKNKFLHSGAKLHLGLKSNRRMTPSLICVYAIGSPILVYEYTKMVVPYSWQLLFVILFSRAAVPSRSYSDDKGITTNNVHETRVFLPARFKHSRAVELY